MPQGRGFRQFLLRGLEKVNGDWLLTCTGHNLLKLFRFGVSKPRGDGPAQRIRNFCRGSEQGTIRKAVWGPTGNRHNWLSRSIVADPQAPLDNPRTGC